MPETTPSPIQRPPAAAPAAQAKAPQPPQGKAPQPAQGMKTNQGAKSAQGKAKIKVKKKANPFAIVCILLVVLVAAFCAMVYFDIGGLKQMVAGALQMEKPTQGQLAEVQAAQKALDDTKADLLKTSTEQKKTASDQKKAASDLDKREKDLQAREQALTTRQAELDTLQQQLAGKQVDQKATVDMFANMDAVKAAKAISGMKSVNDMARHTCRDLRPAIKARRPRY